MAHMAQPWKHPRTGAFYLRRQIPEPLRSAFDGQREYKRSLGTKDLTKARELFVQANAELEREFGAARERWSATGDPRPSSRERAEVLLTAYFKAPATTEGGLDGYERLHLAFLEVDRGLWNTKPDSCISTALLSSSEWVEISANAVLFKQYRRRIDQTAIGRAPAAVWRSYRDGAHEDLRLAQAERVVEQVLHYHQLSPREEPDGLPAAIVAFLDRERLDHEVQARKPIPDAVGLRPTMRLVPLYDEWKANKKPGAQAAGEYRRSVDDFIDYIGDIPVADITARDIKAFAKAVAKMPRSMQRADRALTFTERLAKHGEVEGGKVTATTVKKRVSGVQAMLSFGFEEEWIEANVGLGIKISGYSKGGQRPYSSFVDGQRLGLFQADLFTAPATWKQNRKTVADSSLFWIFLFGLTSGARLEEIGQPSLDDVRRDGAIWYIDITDYVLDERDPEAKSVKNDESCRLVPIHDRLIELGFARYVEALRAAGYRRLFPELRVNSIAKRTQGASQVANRVIDRHVRRDRRLTFHSFRHTFKQRGTTAGLQDRILDQLCGHTPVSTGGRYGYGQPLQVLNRALRRIDFRCVDWAAIKHGTATVDWSEVVRKLPPTEDGSR